MDFFQDVNCTASLVAGVASLVVGFLWYGPLFGKEWMKCTGKTEKDCKEGGMIKPMLGEYINSVVAAYVFGGFLLAVGASDIQDVLLYGVIAWIGFSLTREVSRFIWEKSPLGLLLINSGGALVTLWVMGIVILHFG